MVLESLCEWSVSSLLRNERVRPPLGPPGLPLAFAAWAALSTPGSGSASPLEHCYSPLLAFPCRNSSRRNLA